MVDILVTSTTLVMTWFMFTCFCVSAAAQAYVIDAVIADPSEITCWTCPNKTDNEACNNWAPEKFCPLNHTICQTRHFINVRTGKSVQVLKQCAQPQDCTHDMIGCHSTDIPGVQECISCCNFAYCNEFVPSNHSTAHLYSSLPVNGAAHIGSSSPSGRLKTLLFALLWPLLAPQVTGGPLR